MRTGCRRSTSRSIPAENIIIRGAIAKVMTRPTLGQSDAGRLGRRVQLPRHLRQSVPRSVPRDRLRPRASNGISRRSRSSRSRCSRRTSTSFPVAAVAQRHLHLDRPAAVGAAAALARRAQSAQQAQRLDDHRARSTAPARSLKGVELSLQAPFTLPAGLPLEFRRHRERDLRRFDGDLYRQQGPATVRRAAAPSPNDPANDDAVRPVEDRRSTARSITRTAKFSARASVSYRGPYVDAESAHRQRLRGL